MIVISTIYGETASFVLEVSQTQVNRDCYRARVISNPHIIWSKDFTCSNLAIKEGSAMLKALCLTEKMLDLAEKSYKDALYAQEEGELKEAALLLKRAFFFRKRFYARRAMNLWVDEK